MKIQVNTNSKNYEIIIEKGLLERIESYLNVNKKTLIIYDEKVKNYLDNFTTKLNNAYTFMIKQGEESKSIENYQNIIKYMLENNFSRSDLVIAFGGGVVGDLSGYVASTYKRGCHFINVPTTTLSMIDSSIGGKVAINFDFYKNVIGAFYQPDLVLIDPNVLKSLPLRHFNNGLVEALKAGLIKDKKLYQIFKDNKQYEKLEEVIYRSLIVKKDIVEVDELDLGIRKVLNLGHTIGHALESYFNFKNLLHGEAVAIGLLYMVNNNKLKEDIKDIYTNLNIDYYINFDKNKIFNLIKNDKKITNEKITLIKVNNVEEVIMEDVELNELIKIMEGGI